MNCDSARTRKFDFGRSRIHNEVGSVALVNVLPRGHHDVGRVTFRATGGVPLGLGEFALGMDTSSQLIGRVGRVTGTVGPGRVGEVMVPIRGGSEAFHARAADPAATLPVGTRIVVVEYHPPRSVLVTGA